ncbi:transmembrane protein 107 isoform X2 [Vombatus ursinus]|uniref:transmembrane protein 107 isoform X2 n=1 Tax=Vombatus ursinus TaxID=29139 RepID=UPI000FFD20A5|nr:transmembrane protein 107 isoform X2 [Vombatus ursinus]
MIGLSYRSPRACICACSSFTSQPVASLALELATLSHFSTERTTTSRPVCLPISRPRSMRRRTLSVSMFNSTQSLFSIGVHCCAAVSLAFFIFESWECSTYWCIFAFCSVLPACTEVMMFIAVFVLKKKSF